ncbi:hypothetical protein KCMC57_up34060 [Kitasatospora sp. CMC57]|uniref:Rv2525c-like glycoside hydrolase-like domain-containing protein n=1 Tax=Kitasatospora sp. CMC57 TaxID=3231513 RepID=A0AB33JYD5_9ACTN
MIRYLGPAALTAASLVLLLATDGLPDGSTASAAERGAVAAPGRAASAQAAAPAPVVLRATVLADRPAPRPQTARRLFTGSGFDACTAPPLETMTAWKQSSPYGAVGLYVSGSQRGCSQPRLTADWVRQVVAMGWQLMPTHVGRQAPCSTLRNKPNRIDPATAVQQGQAEAAEAAAALRSLGLGPGSPVYLDIESYPRGDQTCAQSVVDFTVGWTQQLHLEGFRSGFYSSADSGISDLAAAARAGSAPLPDAVWYARWDGRADTTGAGSLDPGQWANHQRIHQYQGNVQETWGGATLGIDRNQVDGPVAS